MTFDPLAPYGQVFGISGVSFAQNGRCYNASGREVIYHTERFTEDGETRDRVVVEPVGAPVEAPEPADMRGAHWRHLAALLAQYDEPYTTKENAFRFLRSRGVDPATAIPAMREAAAAEATDALGPYRARVGVEPTFEDR